MAVLETSEPPGVQMRLHVTRCERGCADIVRELYGNREIPVRPLVLSDELLEMLREND
jgi:hypothetical protein